MVPGNRDVHGFAQTAASGVDAAIQWRGPQYPCRKNRKDITKRFQQFFDHYLKGDPMPKWMKEGIPAIRKGQEWNFELME